MLYSVFILCLNVVTHLSKKRLKSFNDDVEAVVVFTIQCVHFVFECGDPPK